MHGLLTLAIAGWLTAGSREPVSVPFDLLASRHMAVQVLVNGKGPYRVVFDTGAPVNLLSPRVAREAGVTMERRPRQPRQPGLAALPLGPVTKVKELELGELVVKDVPVLVFDHPTVKALASALGPLEGIVGFPVFARFRVTLDYEKKQMTFEPVDYDPGDVMASLVGNMLGNRREAPVKKLASSALLGLRVEVDAGTVRVAEVYPDSAAAAAGVQAGDRLISLSGYWLTDLEDLHLALKSAKPGQSLPLRLRRERDGQAEELVVSVPVRVGL
jgi:membrane-associated protease RseP (regulator of RpoE activity)